MNEFIETCDECGRSYHIGHRYPVTERRPSDRQEMVAIMWLCPRCGKKAGLSSADEIWDAFEEGKKEINGISLENLLWITI